MEAIKKQAARLREQVAKQQQAVLKHLGHFGNEAVTVDEAEFQCYQQLQNLYNSTRSAKHFQKNIVRSIEGFVSASSKQMEIGAIISNVDVAVVRGSTNQTSPKRKREGASGVSEPLRLSVTGAPLEDARHLTHRYEKLRQEVDAQVDAERCYHQHVLDILDKLHAEVIHAFDAQAEGELSLFLDDYVVVRQVAPTGWSEGECRGKAGWFPSAYIEKQEKAPADKIVQEN
ncbi:hypothetical protein GH714_025839 [Hevea brasiliensis]|uniref:SH3 domain-containing protein n=1 Tax=Hevea brasiliensis TaxID=3981 RepID=A0A6A6MAE8_HEVBR|nr:hypothetical protein GH714_025839 [Hevea brasiliensis]